MWLPRWRTFTKPCCSNKAQSCRPEKTLSLPNGDLKPGHEHLVVHATLDFRRVSRFEKQFQGLHQVRACFVDRGALAGNVHLRAQRHIAVALALDPRVSTRWLEQFYRGLAAAARRFSVPIVGGDVAQSDDWIPLIACYAAARADF